MKGLQPLLWEQGLPAQEKPPAKPEDIYSFVKKATTKPLLDFERVVI